MTDEFLTKGLENDRYLKAYRLLKQFDAEIEAVLLEFNQRMVDEHPRLFDSSSEPSVRTNRNSGSALAIHRINHSMDGPRSLDPDLRLNVHMYWLPPTEYGRTDINGALRAFGYKVKGADTDIDDRIVEETRANEWPIKTSKNPFDKNTVFYKHVSTMPEINDTVDTLVDHFSTFGDEYDIG